MVNTHGSDIDILNMGSGISASLATTLYNFPLFNPAINYPVEGAVLKHKTDLSNAIALRDRNLKTMCKTDLVTFKYGTNIS